MSPFHLRQARTTILLLLSLVAPITLPLVTTTATAQTFSQSRQVIIPSGTSIPVFYDKAEKIVVMPNETMPLTLKVPVNVRSRSGTILIPAGSRVIGQLQPASGGSQFVAQELVFSRGKRQPINAESQVISKTQEIRRGSNTTSILKGAAIGGAAAAAIATITGDHAIATEEILGGVGLGALGGLLLGHKKVEVVVINPNTDLNLTLRTQLALR